MWAKEVGCSTLSSSFWLTGSQMWWQEPQQYFWILRPNHAEEGAWSFMIVELPTSLWCLHGLLHERETATVIWGSLCGRSGTYLLVRSPHLRDEKEHVHEECRGRVLQEEETSQAGPVKWTQKKIKWCLREKQQEEGDVKWSRQGTAEHVWLCHEIGAHPWVIEALTSSVSISVKWD